MTITDPVPWGEVAVELERASAAKAWNATGQVDLPPGYRHYPGANWQAWENYFRSVKSNAELRLANLSVCLREASMLATLEHRIFSTLAAPIVIRVDPAKDSEIRERVRSMSGIGAIVDAYKRCRYVFRRGNPAGVTPNSRCGHEEGHVGAHSPYAPGEEDRS